MIAPTPAAPPVFLIVLAALWTLCSAASAAPDLPVRAEPNERWVLVDTAAHELVVFSGKHRVATFDGVAIGRGGVSENRSRGDRTTPAGEYRINRINDQSDFHLFLGLDFPTPADADRAFRNGRMSREEYRNYLDGLLQTGQPPQNTSLGGHIGIHGLGDGDEHLHRLANWTDGCIALEDDQMDELASMIGIGTRVIIR